jgi:hypothetical protein
MRFVASIFELEGGQEIDHRLLSQVLIVYQSREHPAPSHAFPIATAVPMQQLQGQVGAALFQFRVSWRSDRRPVHRYTVEPSMSR